MTRKFDSTPPIYFYLDPEQVPVNNLPQNTQSYWQWQCAENSISQCKVEVVFGRYKPISISRSLDFPAN